MLQILGPCPQWDMRFVLLQLESPDWWNTLEVILWWFLSWSRDGHLNMVHKNLLGLWELWDHGVNKNLQCARTCVRFRGHGESHMAQEVHNPMEMKDVHMEHQYLTNHGTESYSVLKHKCAYESSEEWAKNNIPGSCRRSLPFRKILKEEWEFVPSNPDFWQPCML